MRYSKITVNKLKQFGACYEAIEEFEDAGIKSIDSIKLLKRMYKKDEYLEWANWLITRVMTRKQYLAYAIYAAEQVLNIYEKKHPDDDKPRKAIEAAKKVLKKDTKKNRNVAAAAYAAAAYAAAAYAAAAAAAAYAAAAADAAYAAYVAAAAARIKLQRKILRYGIKLLEQ